MDHASDAPVIFEFGRFRVVPHRRELLADGRPIKLGGREFDLLLALIEVPGAVIGKEELMNRVWAARIVEENSLQGAISALRKAFGADRDLIRTVAGRGYQFTGEARVRSAGYVERAAPGLLESSAKPVRTLTNLREPVSELIGREAELSEVMDLVATQRLVTLIGEGGIGKTRLGLEVARHLLPEFPDGVRVAELAPLSDQNLVPATVATAFGLEFAGGTISADGIANALGSKQVMLVLDNCEHVIAMAASMAEALLHANSAARVLATSREPLRAEGECLYRVPPLAVPAEATEDIGQLLRHGAVRLFVARARAANPHFSPDSGIAPPSREFAAVSTASRWRSSWRRRAVACSGYPRLLHGSMIGFTCLPEVTGPHCPASRRCGQRLTGAMISFPSPSEWCCAAWQYLLAGLP